MQKDYPALSLDDLMPYGKFGKKKTIEQLIEEETEYLKFCCDEHNLLLDNEAWEYLQDKLIELGIEE